MGLSAAAAVLSTQLPREWECAVRTAISVDPSVMTKYLKSRILDGWHLAM